MTRSVLFPVLLVSGLAFAADPAAPAIPATPAATSAKPAIPLAVFKDLDKAELTALADLGRDFSIVDTDKQKKM